MTKELHLTITIAGVQGSGKTTYARRLAELLSTDGFTVIVRDDGAESFAIYPHDGDSTADIITRQN